LKKFLKIAENPGKFYESLNYNDKRVFQNIVFPEGFMFSLKNKECRTSKMNVIFDLTNSFKDAYGVKIKKTQIQKVLESRIVAGTGFIASRCLAMGQRKKQPKETSNLSFTPRDLIDTHHIMTLISRNINRESFIY